MLVCFGKAGKKAFVRGKITGLEKLSYPWFCKKLFGFISHIAHCKVFQVNWQLCGSKIQMTMCGKLTKGGSWPAGEPVELIV